MITQVSRLSCKTLVAAAVVLMGSAGSSFAATSNWSTTFDSPCTGGAGAPIANAGAWGAANCADVTPYNSAPAGSTKTFDVDVAGLAFNKTTLVATGAKVVSWGDSGLGVMSGTETDATGPHAVDSYGDYDSIVMRFTESVSVNYLSIGWNGTDDSSPYKDSDVQLYAWTGAAPAAGAAPTSLTMSGWSLVQSLTDVGGSNGISPNSGGSASFSANGISSSYWLVAAMGSDTTADSFKLLSLAGTFRPTTGGSVPEPGSLALLGLGAAGLLAARRKAVARR